MALAKDTNFRGVTIPNAYIRVNSFSGSKSHIAFDVGFYGPANEQGEREMFDQQAYEHLKTMPEFAGAQDC